jgi:dienelactone hydrolase
MRRVVAVLLAACVLAGCSSPTGAPSHVAQVSSSPSPSPISAQTGHAPAKTFAVGTRTLKLHRGNRPLTTTVYYPKNTPGRFPVVVFGHGLGGKPTAYADLLRRWASAGFVVAAPAFPHTAWGVDRFDVLDVPNQPADMGAVYDGLVALPPGDALRKLIDPTRAAAAGHSAGAITTVGVFSDDGPEGRDKRFAAGIVLAGNTIGVGQTFSGKPAPMLFVHAAEDPVVPYWTGQGAYQDVPWPRAFVRLPGKEHTLPYLARSNKQFALVAAATVDFLRWALYGDAAARGRLAHVQGIDDQL